MEVSDNFLEKGENMTPKLIDMNFQAALNRAYTFLWWQNRQSHDGEACDYMLSGCEEVGCAMRPILGDDLAREISNSPYNGGVANIRLNGWIKFPSFKDEDFYLSLQLVHDKYSERDGKSFRSYLNTHFLRLAKEFGLHFCPLDEIEHASKVG